ncbi:Holliday junction branch migration protein RuvA [Fulvivirgaceae bacterium BMA12]|uniref:Holliday junction branch migration complex subunit RuvA n=1 Tax=Agaribacillus aureus TaxID=3051825 RepID=A0ABT8LEV6_9BACT|nr:Holliday junction branch migration protein RuvA [Fulvivirgaceae bacterium BMA12]
MIAYIEGKLTHKDPTFVIIDIGGLGYEIKISLSTFGAIKHLERCKLHTHLNVKEDSHTLFGFFELIEKKLFLSLISISGVGPSTGLMVLSSLSAAELQQAIINGDVSTIQSVKGIGAKTAQRIVLELKDKMAKENLGDNNVIIQPKSHNTVKREALSALITLGYNKGMAEKTVDRILKNSGDDISLEELIRLALKTA